MRCLPLEATTTTGNREKDRNESSIARRPAHSSPPKSEQRRNRGGGAEGEEVGESPRALVETEKLRAGIQQLLSSAPVPPSPCTSLAAAAADQEQKQHKQVTPKRRVTTPRRAATSATKTPAASNVAGAPLSSSSSSSAAVASPSSRPRRAQLSLFSVSKPPLKPGASHELRAGREKERMEDQALVAAAAVPAAAAGIPAAALSPVVEAASPARGKAGNGVSGNGNTPAPCSAAPSPTPAAPLPVPVPPPPPQATLDPRAAFRAALSAVNAARAGGTAAGGGVSSSSSAVAVGVASNEAIICRMPPLPPSPCVFAAGGSTGVGAGGGGGSTAATPLRTQQQQQQQQFQAWASPAHASQHQNSNNSSGYGCRLSFQNQRSFQQQHRQQPPTPHLPPGGVDDVYRDFARQQEAADWADGVNRLAFAEMMRRREEEEEEEGQEGQEGDVDEEGRRRTRKRPSTMTSSAPTFIDDAHFFDPASCQPDPVVIDVESLPSALYEPVKVFCVEVPVDNPVMTVPGTTMTGAGGMTTTTTTGTAAAPSPEGASAPRTHYRRFVAASYPAFLRRYLSRNAASTGGRHVYEVLRESRPCHAYFDVEFARRANPGADGDAAVDALVAAVRAELAPLVGERAAKAALLVESDSSTPAKFSRHLILRLPGKLAFRDNASVGMLLAQVLSRDGAAAKLRVAKEEPGDGGNGGGNGGVGFSVSASSSPLIGGGASAQQRRGIASPSAAAAASASASASASAANSLSYSLAIAASSCHAAAPSNSSYTWIADTAVYTKNRHFRVLWSSKGGKGTVLEPTARHAHARGAPLDAAETPRRVLMLSSLAANVEPGTKLIDVASGGFCGGGGSRVAIAGVVSGSGGFFGNGAGAARRLVRRETILHRSGGRSIKFEWKHDALDGVAIPPSSATTTTEQENNNRHQQQRQLQHQQQPDPRLVEAALAAVPFVEELAIKRAGSTPPGAATGDAYVRSAAVTGPTTSTAVAASNAATATTAAARAAGATATSSLPPLRSAVVAFSLLGPASRWCEFVGRRHRSNHSYFVLDFGDGKWYQKCYDPECWGKRSRGGALPKELLVQLEK